MNLPLRGAALIEVIPQQPPFVFISELKEINGNRCTTSFLITEKCLLVKDGKLSSGGLIENMAQSAAAKVGYEYKLANKTIPVGFIGDVRHFENSNLPLIGEEIFTTIEIENEVFGVTLISGKVKLNGEKIASCKMKIFIDEEKTATAQSVSAEKK